MLNKKLKTNMERLPTTRKTVGKFALTVLLVFLVASAFCVGTAVATDETKEVHVSPSYSPGNATHFPTLEDALNATKDFDARIVLDANITLNKLLIVGALNDSKIVIDGQNHIITLAKDFKKPEDGLHNIIFLLTLRTQPITLKDVVVDFNDNTGDMLIRDAKDQVGYNSMEPMQLINVTIANANVTDLTDFGSTLHIAGARVYAQNLQFMFTNQSTGQYEEPNTLAEYMVSYIDLSAGRTVDHGSVLIIDNLPIGAVGKYSTVSGLDDKPKVIDSHTGEEAAFKFLELGFLETKIRFWFGFKWAPVKEIATWDDLKNVTSTHLKVGTILNLTDNIVSPDTGAANVTIPVGVIVKDNGNTIKVNAKDSISVMDMMGLRTLLGESDKAVTFGNGTVVIHDNFTNDIIFHQSYYLVPGTTIQVSEVGTKGNVTITLPADSTTFVNGENFHVSAGKNVTVVGGTNAEIKIMDEFSKKDTVVAPYEPDSYTGGAYRNAFVVYGVVNLYVPVELWPTNGVAGSGTINFYVDPYKLPAQHESVKVNYCPFKLAPGVDLYKNGVKVANPLTELCANGSTWSHDGTNVTIPADTSDEKPCVYTVKVANGGGVAQWKIPATYGVVSKMHMFNAVVEPAATVYVDEHIVEEHVADKHVGNYYKTIDAALEATKGTEKIIKLESDVTLTKHLRITGNGQYNITIDGQNKKISLDKKNWTAVDMSNIFISLSHLQEGKAVTLKDVYIDFAWVPGDLFIYNSGEGHPKAYLTNVTLDGINIFNLTKLRSGIHINGADVVVKNLTFDESHLILEHWAKTIDLEATSRVQHGSTLTIDNLPYIAYGKYAFYSKEPTVINSTSGEVVEPITLETFLSVYAVDIWLPFGTSKVYDVGTWKEFVDATKKVKAGDVIRLTDNITANAQFSVRLPERVIVNPSANGVNHTITLDATSIYVEDTLGLVSLLGVDNPIVQGNGTIHTAVDFKNNVFIPDELYVPARTDIQFREENGTKFRTISLPKAISDDNTLVVPGIVSIGDNVSIVVESKESEILFSTPSVRIVSVENQTSPFTVNGVVSFKVPVEEWPTTGVSGSGSINIYEKSVLPSKTGNVKFYFTPIKEAHHGTILEHVVTGADQGLDTLYENGTKWELSDDGKILLIGNKNRYSLSPESGYVGNWNLTGTTGVITNARMIQPVFVKEEKTSSSSSSSSKSKGGSILLSTGASSVASSASSTAATTATTESTAAVTAVPTTVPTTAPTTAPTTVAPTATKTAKPTQTAASPLPFAGILAGLGAAAVLFGMRRQ